jgi:hypothetical protein
MITSVTNIEIAIEVRAPSRLEKNTNMAPD